MQNLSSKVKILTLIPGIFNNINSIIMNVPAKNLSIIIITSFLMLSVQLTKAQVYFDFETGVVATGYNDVRIPGSTGTFISLPDDLGAKPGLFARINLGYKIGEKSEVFILYAPLTVKYEGEVESQVDFYGEAFSPAAPILATYKFNSYRASYRYCFLCRDNFNIRLGLTIKVRDAFIGLEQNRRAAKKTDLGAVPLINFGFYWHPTENTGLILEGDALGVPSGRAEDVLLAFTYNATSNIMLKTGYRILEGGADNNKLYTFSLFHYGVIGAKISFPSR